MFVTLVGGFMGKFVKGESLKGWLLENFILVIRYNAKFHILL
jgi:hypothetical protein